MPGPVVRRSLQQFFENLTTKWKIVICTTDYTNRPENQNAQREHKPIFEWERLCHRSVLATLFKQYHHIQA